MAFAKSVMKAETCHFHSDTVSFLGFIVSAGSIQMDPAKVEAVKDWPVTETRKALQQFLGFVNFYQRFIQGYLSLAHSISSPLQRRGLTPFQVVYGYQPPLFESQEKESSVPSARAPLLDGVI
ncbi:hypothetical protein QTP70_005521 [Hemibagrus guttatus]|uniref:Reverse transcriptase n=1 Tax=Hemibagrus guttatus TaxID=175788 RepID=A0AAE0UUY0_9TELE|nr:hypothetical protein QTP70_005521 [Hemibagrus guttatus]